MAVSLSRFINLSAISTTVYLGNFKLDQDLADDFYFYTKLLCTYLAYVVDL